MDINKLDKALIDLVETKIALSGLSYDDPKYDDLEELLHDQEDEFVENYGDYIEEALRDVHDEFCPDSEVLLPIAYLANEYIKKESDGKVTYTTLTNQGVPVDMDDFPDKKTRIVLIPAPTRLVLIVDAQNQQVVWKAE
ncbi:hypothetical protein [uncultured Imperialibacter sp.]|uniref:hypothetical protein n=1 Tax=uncultured Imperialibacter sp. TaxID=1672639 RepID=UPI0030D76958